LLSGSEDQTAQLWRLASGKPEGPPFMHDDKVLAVAFTSDANTILTATGKGVFQWDQGTRKSRDFAFPTKKPARMVAFSPDGKRVLESESGSTRLWDLSAASPREPLITVQHTALSSIVWQPDGRRFLTGDREGDVRIWSVDGGSPAGPILHLQGAV